MDNKSRRKQYFRERHRAPPDVDWKAVERQNGLDSLARRNALSRANQTFTPAWEERGSENQAGRMMVAALSADGHSLYAGSSLGGVWRGTLQGDDWEPLGDNLYGGAHWLALFPPAEAGQPEVMLAATDGGLVHRSADDGATWEVPTGLPELWSVHRLLKLQDGSHAAFLVGRSAQDQHWRLYRSTDGAASWQELLDMEDFRGDVWAPRDGGSSLWLANGGFLVSEDLGETWTEITREVSTRYTFERIELAGSEAGAPTFYLAGHRAADDPVLMRSDDGGITWASVRDLQDYWGVLVASAVDPGIAVWGGVELHRTGTGGPEFSVVNGWGEYYEDPLNKLHADIMGVDLIPDGEGGETWYIGTDGGLYESRDGVLTVENLSMRGLRVSQYYDTLTSTADPSQVAAGAQDQGYQVTNGIAQGGERWDFEQVLSGDYGHLTSSDGTHDFVYSVYPGFVLVQMGGEEPELRVVDFPPASFGAWLPPVVADPERKRAFFWAGSQLWYYDYDPTLDTWGPQVWSEQDFGAGSGEYLSGLAFSPHDPNHAVGVTSLGRVFHSEDKGVSWTESDALGPQGNYLYGTTVTFDPDDPDTVYLAGSGYGGPAVYRSKTGGRNWKPFDEGLPDTLVYSLCEAPDGSGILVAGTETGAWRRDPGPEQTWVEVTGTEAPVTLYWSCEALQHENTIRFGTYGRGIWDYQLDPEGEGCFPPVDEDGDGFECDVDCDDADPDIHPGAVELPCDGVDSNCEPADDPSPKQCAEAEAARGGCGCATEGSGPGGLVWFGLIALWGRRQGR